MQFFWDNLEIHGKNTALISEQETISYEQLLHIGEGIVKDIPKRSLVFLICKNNTASVAGYVAFLRKRVAVVLLSSTLDRILFENLCHIYKPQFIWCPDKFIDDAGSFFYDDYKLVSTGNDCPKMNSKLSVMITTSGSTGSPKFVRLSYQNIQTNTESITKFLEIRQSDKAITALPMNYVYGLSIIQSHLMSGASIILTERNVFDGQFWEIFKKNGATTFGTVPYTYQMLDKMHFFNMELPSLRYLTQAGGRLSKDLHYKIGNVMQEKGKKFIVMYGASEATARMSYVPFDMTIEKAGSVGIAIPGGRFELIDSDGNIISDDDETGELVYFGPNVMLGYAENREDLGKDDEMHGRFATGDFAKRDSDGFYYIIGRKSDFVKIFGNRVCLAEIEEILTTEGYEVACIGEEDRIHIYTTSKECEEIIAYISKKTGLNPIAFIATTLESIPRNQAGKTLYSML